MMIAGKEFWPWVASLWLLLSAISQSLGQAPLAQPRGPETIAARPQEAYSGVSLPNERIDSRGIQQSIRQIEQGHFTQAIRYLDEVLQRNEDSFVWMATSGDWIGVKKIANQILGDLPPAGREAYDAMLGPVAQRELQAFASSGNWVELQKIAQRYFHTQAGQEAALLLAQHEADLGRHLAAGLTYEQLLATPEARARLDPQLSLLAASNWLASKKHDRAKALIADLVERRAILAIAGEKHRFGMSAKEELQWLLSKTGAPVPPQIAPEREWLLPRGNAAQTGKSEGGLPHMRMAWQVRMLPHPQLETVHQEMYQAMGREGRAVLPAAFPLAANDYIISRSARNLVAIDFKTGKRVWQAQPQRFRALEQLTNEAGRPLETAQGGTSPSRALAQRIWEDYLYNTISSDGQRVFVIRDLAPPRPRNMNPFGRRPNHNDPTAAANRLCAYDLPTQGKLVWEIDGAARRDEFQHAFFLGAPLAVDQTLYCLYETGGDRAIYVAALEQKTGALQWQQRIADLETGVLLDPERRLQAMMPAYDSGILVCPTGTGLVVGIDLAKNSLAWAYRYETRRKSIRDLRRRQLHAQTSGSQALWADSSTLIADGNVLLTSPKSDSLHCLDLATGKLRWKETVEDQRFLAAVEGDRVLLIGNRRLTALGLHHGKPVWPQSSMPLPDQATPSGRGFLSHGNYYLPLSTAEVIVVDVEKGQIVDQTTSRDKLVLGNLICYRGAVISQTGRSLDRFEQVDVLRHRVQKRLGENAEDFRALRTLGEIAYYDGDLRKAIDLLEQAYTLDSDNLQTREVFSECLLTALDEDFSSYRDYLPLLTQLQDASGLGRLALLRLQSQGLLKEGETVGAFEICLEMFRLGGQGPSLLSIGREHQVELTRWIRAQVVEIARQATEDNRQAISDLMAEWLVSIDSSSAEDSLQRFYDCFGTLEPFDPIGMRIAKQLLENGELLAAQQLLLHLVDSEDEQLRAEATARCSQMLHNLELHQLADSFDQQLTTTFASLKCLDGMTGAKWVAQQADTQAQRALKWPFGEVQATLGTSGSDQDLSTIRTPWSEVLLESTDTVLGGCNIFFGSNRQVLLRDGRGEPFFRAVLDPPNGSAIYPNGSTYGASRGNLLILSMGHQVVALNTLPHQENRPGELLWRRTTASKYSSGHPTLGRAKRYNSPRPGSRRTPRTKQNDQWIGILGPITHDSCVFQEHQRLVCVDPLTGKLLWSRTTETNPCDLFGDSEYVFSVPEKGTTAKVFSTIDGRLLREVEIPTWGEQLAKLGRRIVRWRRLGNRKMELSSLDAFSGELVWQHLFERGSQVDVAQNRFVSVVEPSGRCTIVDATNGLEVAQQESLFSKGTRQIHLFSGLDNFVVAAQSRSKPSSRDRMVYGLNNQDYLVSDWETCVFDRQTGKPTFERPATVERQPLMLTQPVDLPVIAFAGRVQRRDGRNRSQHMSVLLLEKATGRVLYQDDQLPPSVNRFAIRAPNGSNDTIVVDMLKQELRLEFTNEARAPEPPAMHQVTVQAKSSPAGLIGIGRKLLEGR